MEMIHPMTESSALMDLSLGVTFHLDERHPVYATTAKSASARIPMVNIGHRTLIDYQLVSECVGEDEVSLHDCCDDVDYHPVLPDGLVGQRHDGGEYQRQDYCIDYRLHESTFVSYNSDSDPAMAVPPSIRTWIVL